MDKCVLTNRLDEFIKELKYNERAENTLKKYKGNIRGFIDYLDPDIEITKENTLAYKQHLIDEEYRTSTINSYIISVNKYLKWIGCPELVVKQLKQQRKNSIEEYLSIEDYKRMLRFAKAARRMDIYYIMKILAMTGIRIGELEYFKVENLKSNYIKVTNKGKERSIVLRQDLIRELRKYCKDYRIRKGYLFPGEVHGKMMNQSTIWRNMKKFAGRARVNKAKVHAHSFRHLFAKQFLNQYENNITELADILGHNSLETTRIYTRSSDAEKRKKMERMKY